MPTHTFKIANVCSGGEHITLNIFKDGTVVKSHPLTKTEVTESDATVLDAAFILCRQAIRDKNATTPAQRKAAIEGIVVMI